MNISVIDMLYLILFLSSIVIITIFLMRLYLVFKNAKHKFSDKVNKIMTFTFFLLFLIYFSDYIIKLIYTFTNMFKIQLSELITSSAFSVCFIIFSFVLNMILRENYGEDLLNDNK